VGSEENKRFHLNMIQDTIKRMASNSFVIKGWSITAIGAIYAYWIKCLDYNVLLLILGITLLFWWHDSYYLWLERRYRDLYSEVATKTEDNIDFSMAFLNPNKEKVICVMISRPILFGTYGLITLATLIILIVSLIVK
jgi:hypothetical protein